MTATDMRATGDARGTVLGAALASEWIKLRSLRSTMWSLFAAFAITVGLGSLFCYAYVARYDRLDIRERLGIDPTARSIRGVFLAALALGVLGVLVMSAEYATGTIRVTLSATPQRSMVLAAKAAVFTAVAAVVSLVTAFTAFGAGQAILAGKHAGVSLGDPEVLRAVLGAAAYMTIVGVLGLSFAVILRRTAGAVATLVGVVFIADLLVQALPSPWNTDISKFLPGVAGLALFTVRSNPDRLSPGWSFVVLLGWLFVTGAVAVTLLARRDA